MSETVTVVPTPLTQSDESQRWRYMAGMGMVSFAALLLEISLTRLFSVVLFYHFAFLAISVALLGLGAGGVFSFVRREWLMRWRTRHLAAALCAVNAVVILVVLEIVLHLPISLDLSRGNFLRLTLVYVVTAVPFFFTGVVFSVVFARESQVIGRIYGADLLGGALACLLVVPALNWIGGPNAVLLAAVAMGLAGAVWADSKRLQVAAAVIALGFVALIAGNRDGKLIDVIYAKGALRDPQWVEFAKWNAISRIEVNSQGGARYIVIDADATSAIMNADPKNWEQDTAQPTPTGTGLPAEPAFNWRKALMSAAPAVANVLRPSGHFAIIGPGGGVDVLRAVANGGRVTGIEINPIIANDIMRGKYGDYSYNLYRRPEVQIHVGDGRSWIRQSREKYDVVQMTLVDTWASTAAGAFALSENNLYTVEAFCEYFDHLRDDGFIAVTRWEFKEPREALRVVSQAAEALRQMGVPDARKHFIIVSDGALDVDGRPVLVLAKKTPFAQADVAAMLQHVRENANLFLIYAPGAVENGEGTLSSVQWAAPAALQVFGRFIDANAAGQRADFVRGYGYDVSSVSDDAPFFFFTLKTGHVLKNVFAGTGRGMDWRINLGVTVLFLLLVISVVAVVLFLLLPMALAAHAKAQSKVSLLYFVAVGLGYILVEIALIQRFVLYLGHPTYALTVVVFLMLLSSGLGSMASRRWIAEAGRGRLLLTLLGIVGVVLAYLWLVPQVLAATIGASFAAKLGLSGLLLIPLGFVMGMPFPSGVRAIGRGPEGAVEWAYAMNAAATVLGSVSAMVIAIHFGLTVTLAVGAVAYLLAAGLSGRLQRA